MDPLTLRAALAGALVAGLSGCNRDCVETGALSTVFTELGVDYLALRATSESESGWDTGDTGAAADELREYEAYGDACATASDAVSCAEALDEAWPTEGGGDWLYCSQDGCTYYGLVTTQGDEVTLAQSIDEVVALFGGIDTEAKASALVSGPLDYSAPMCGSIKEVDGGFQMEAEVTTSECPITWELHRIEVSTDGELEVLKVLHVDDSGACVGRRPGGLLPAGPVRSDAVGRHLAHMARLEGAAVVAFERMAQDLERLGAPRSLVERALAAAGDEIVHARLMAELARAHGVSCLPVEVEPQDELELFAFALENAVEGCVRETFGVVDAAFRATRAPTAELRALYARIAADEARHAELSWDVAAWVEPLLDEHERNALALARTAAHDELRGQLARERPSQLARQLGAPRAEEAVAMAEHLQQRLAS